MRDRRAARHRDALALLGMLLQPRAGLALIETRGLASAFAVGAGGWLLLALHDRSLPRFGATFETATAIAIAPAFDDSDRALSRIEALYRETAVAPADGSSPPAA